MRQSILFLLLGTFVLSCQSIDLEDEKRAIQAQIDQVEKAHHNKDANQFFQPNSDSWYDVRQGLVEEVDKKDVIAPTQGYLDNMEFQEMIQHHDPIIEVSEDGTLATYIGAVTVKGVFNGTPTYFATSWQNTLRKIEGEWKIISQVNSDANENTTATILLNQVRSALGFELLDNSSIYAYAECQGPRESFQTLLLSRSTDGRMEQIFGPEHIIVKHGADTTWTYSLKAGRHLENPRAKMFVSGHELHWLSFRPEDRYSNPTFKGIVGYENQNAFHVEFRDEANNPVNFYYSFDNYLPIAFESQVSPQGDLAVVRFHEWDKVDGISVFRKATFTAFKEVFNYNYTDIRLNILADDDFESREALVKEVG